MASLPVTSDTVPPEIDRLSRRPILSDAPDIGSPRPQPVVFSGDRRSFFRLASRGAALEFVTLGFYRFWLATDMRRHLWSHTVIGGHAAEYIGTGRELLIGFLFALAILAPVYLLYFLAGIELERAKAFGSIPLVLFFYAFGQFAVFRARRYRLTRTVWRGVRFWMTGSGTSYALRAILWAIPVILTLGLLLPWREAALERYKMRNSHYGDLQGRFEGRGWDFFKRGWFLWAIAMAFLAAFVFTPILVKQNKAMGVVPVVLLLFVPSLFGAFKATEWRWWLSGIRFGDVRIESSLRRGALTGLYWKVIGWVLLLGVLLGAYLAACWYALARFGGVPLEKLLASGMSSGSLVFIAVTAVGYLVYLLAFNVVLRMYLLRDLWRRVIQSVEVHNLAAADDVTGIGTASSALGEGLADGLDVAGF